MDINQSLKQALQLQQDDDLDKAQALFEQILGQDPKQADALHGLGLLFAQKRAFDKALPYFQQAVSQAPHIPGFHNNLGNTYKALKNPNLAQTHYQQALKLKSPYPEARNNLGHLLYQQGMVDEAVQELVRAVREDPEHVDAHYNLANCYIQQERITDAIGHYQAILKLRPDHLGATHNLGIALTALKDFKAAKPLLEAVIEREPDNVDALFHSAIIQASLGQLDGAIKLYQRTLEVDPNHADSYHNMATVYLHLKQKNEALTCYQRAFALNPNNATAKHMIAALMGEEDDGGAPLEYVRALFDQYAYTYDQHVTENLEYQVPGLLRQAMSESVSSMHSLWHILDLGCGTGLCAPYFRDIADTLTGVDLSPNMVEVAKSTGGYDRLIVDSIEAYLNKTKEYYDCILCCDVFVYFAKLDELFESVFEHLNDNARFAFSIETHDTAGKDYLLRETGRYAHHPKYIEQLALSHAFTIKHQQNAQLRKQEDAAIFGAIYILEKTKGTSA